MAARQSNKPAVPQPAQQVSKLDEEAFNKEAQEAIEEAFQMAQETEDLFWQIIEAQDRIAARKRIAAKKTKK